MLHRGPGTGRRRGAGASSAGRRCRAGSRSGRRAAAAVVGRRVGAGRHLAGRRRRRSSTVTIRLRETSWPCAPRATTITLTSTTGSSTRNRSQWSGAAANWRKTREPGYTGSGAGPDARPGHDQQVARRAARRGPAQHDPVAGRVGVGPEPRAERERHRRRRGRGRRTRLDRGRGRGRRFGRRGRLRRAIRRGRRLRRWLRGRRGRRPGRVDSGPAWASGSAGSSAWWSAWPGVCVTTPIGRSWSIRGRPRSIVATSPARRTWSPIRAYPPSPTVTTAPSGRLRPSVASSTVPSVRATVTLTGPASSGAGPGWPFGVPTRDGEDDGEGAQRPRGRARSTVVAGPASGRVRWARAGPATVAATASSRASSRVGERRIRLRHGAAAGLLEAAAGVVAHDRSSSARARRRARVARWTTTASVALDVPIAAAASSVLRSGEVAQGQRLLVARAQAVHRGQHLGDGVALADLVGRVARRRRQEPRAPRRSSDRRRRGPSAGSDRRARSRRSGTATGRTRPAAS